MQANKTTHAEILCQFYWNYYEN